MLSDEDARSTGRVSDGIVSSSSDDNTLTHILRQFSPILVPILFALFIFLFSLVAYSRGIANLTLLPLGLILLALVVMQGTMLYYAGNNDTFWMLSLIGGYLLFLLVGAFVFFWWAGALILLGIMLVLGGFFGSRGIRQVPEGQVHLVHRFGRYSRTLYPGLNFLFPWEYIQAHVFTWEITWTTPTMHITTSREQYVDIVASVTYRLLPEDAHIAVMNIANWEADLHQRFLGVLRSVVYELTPADFVGWAREIDSRPQVVEELADPMAKTRWDRLNSTLRRRLQNQVAKRGIKIRMVVIQDINLKSRPETSEDRLDFEFLELDDPPHRSSKSDTSPSPAVIHKPIKIFFCYAHEDEQLLKGIKKQMGPLQRLGLIDVWYDRDINAGIEWEKEIRQQLNESQIILLLISPDFMDSNYCYSVEMKRAIERHDRGEAHVIPIILRPSYWEETPVGKLQALPTDGKPITLWSDRDLAFDNVVRGVGRVIQILITQT